MTIRKKILLGFIIMAVIGISLGVVGLVSMKSLTRMSADLNELQVGYIGVGDVLNAHFKWRQSLTETVLTGAEFTGSLDPNSCALGKWRGSDEAKNLTDETLLSLLTAVTAPHEFIHHEAESIISDLAIGDHASAEDHLVNAILPKTQEVITILTDMEQRYIDMIEEKTVEIENTSASISSVILVLVCVAVVACALLAVLLTKNIVKPLIPLSVFMNKAGSTGDITLSNEDIEVIGKISKVKDEIGVAIAACASFVGRITEIGGALKQIADGDLNVEIKVLSDADMMGHALQDMVNNLNAMFSEINTASSQVTVGASQVANSSQMLAQGSTEQAASVHQLSASVNDITDRTKSSAVMAEDAASKSVSIREKAERGNEHMCNLVEAVTEIHEAGESINKIIKVIDDIAFQTNILALNAAVEAARAGQHGKGFAVVAEEVRNLAAKSAEAAKDTAGMIENTIEKSNLGLSIATDTAASLREIVDEIEMSVEAAHNIASLAEDQNVAISQINIGIDQVSQVIQQNSATAEESAATSEELSGQAMSLQELIGRFKLKGGGRIGGASSGRKVLRIAEQNDGHVYAAADAVVGFGKY
ncbi:MAG: methyl-accepting chemotaxis protein [Oscillospiraceae bacterium]|nr:methyl-accepting chemotaxis protein [Oscillospiraceae bacterium]